jgi:hypothetical protein
VIEKDKEITIFLDNFQALVCIGFFGLNAISGRDF